MKRLFIFLMHLVFVCTANAQVTCSSETVYSGEGTYYDIAQFGNFGNCSIENSEFQPFLIGAMNASQYGLADFCGSCVQIQGPKGTVKVHIIDQCPECKYGDIDLSPAAFDYLAPRIDGRIPISWKLVPCTTTGNIQFYFKTGSSQYWTAVQVRNHRYKLAKLEYKNTAGNYVNVPRLDYNYFVATSGFGMGPYTFRVTDVYGNQVVETNISLTLTTEINGKSQFPACSVVAIEEQVQTLEWVKIENKKIVIQEELNYELYNNLGQSIHKGKAEKGKQIELQTGFYILKLEWNGMVKSEKISIE